MPSKDDIREALVKWTRILQDPEIAKDFEGYNKTMQFVFPDIDVKMQLVFKGANVSIVDGFKENADMSLTVDAQMFMGIVAGEIDPMDAFMEGKLKPVGAMPDLEKLQVLLLSDND
jgi:putative sterol carrier protein